MQGEVADPIKNKVSHTSRYADLPQILEVCRPLLSKHGLSVMQFPGNNNGKMTVETILTHKSGEWVSGIYEMDMIEQKGTNAAQAAGIVITYMRRYALTALMGIAAQDDTDANINSNKKLTGTEVDLLLKACNNNKDKIEGIMKWANVSNVNELSLDQYLEVMKNIKNQSTGA